MADDWDHDVNDGHLRSFIFDTGDRHGCREFNLTIWTYFDFYEEEYCSYRDVVWKVEKFANGEPKTFKDAFIKQLKDGWGNGAVWLVHEKKGLKDLWCELDIIDYPKPLEAHMVVRVVKNPISTNVLKFEGGYTYPWPVWKGGCHPVEMPKGGKSNPIDMTLSYAEVVFPPANSAAEEGIPHPGSDKDGNGKWFFQFTAQHEFGHYLKLEHPCQAVDPQRKYPLEAYCNKTTFEQMEKVMAMGSVYGDKDGRARTEGIPFRARLAMHGYVDTKVEAWVAKGHTHQGGGDRHHRPWPDGYSPKFDTLKEDPEWVKTDKMREARRKWEEEADREEAEREAKRKR